MSQPSQNKYYSLGLTELTYTDNSRIFDGQPRQLKVLLWYPTPDTAPLQKMHNETWKIKDVIKNASFPTNAKLPLIIFSHGYSDNQWQNSWFAENFAENGYIIAAVNHYSNSMHNMIPEICRRPWDIPQDMSFVLDELLTSEYAEYIDVNRIGAAGFSQGGIACFWLAGARAHLIPENIKQQMLPPYYDARFKAVFSMAPSIDNTNVIFTHHELAQVKTPTYIITGEANNDTIEQTLFFAHNIPYCTCTILSGQVNHWTLLNEGTEEGKINRPDRTVDHPSINREEIHGVVSLEALMFFDKHLRKKP